MPSPGLAVDQEGKVLKSSASKTRDKAALKSMKKTMKRHRMKAFTTHGLRACKAVMKDIGNASKQDIGRWATTGWRTHTYLSDDENGPW